MIRRATFVTTVLTAMSCSLALGQATSPTILEIDLENLVRYFQDPADVSKYGTDPNLTTQVPPRDFVFDVTIGDIVAVNGQPAKGTYTRNSRLFFLTPSPGVGQAIADVVRNAVVADTFEILKSDGNPIGTIVSNGPSGGSPPPGAPLSITQGNLAITGGTGAFLGVRGLIGQAVTPSTIQHRNASVTEDPASRRRNGGGRERYVLQVIPMSQPQIVATSSGPAVTHSSDFTLVTASRPAAAGEILSLFATGLGPTRPGIDPGKPFPTSPQQVVNSPVDVTVNGRSAEVLAAVGYPSAVDGFQVNFRMPPDIAKGMATIQLSAAWIASIPVGVAVQ